MFEGQYLTYAEYTSLGGTLEQTPFNLLEYEARKQIDLRTQNRLVGVEEIPKQVKLCDFHLIAKIESYAEAASKANSSVENESIDGYSIKYITATQMEGLISSKNTEFQDIMMHDLYGVIVNGEHIIYNGAL